MIKLVNGKGSPETGGCWMSALNWMVNNGTKGFCWTDQTECVDPVIRALCIRINDGLSDDRRADVIMPYLFLPVGTARGRAMSIQRAYRVADVAVRQWAAEAMEQISRNDLAGELRALAPIIDKATTTVGRNMARKARNAATADAAAAYATAAAAAYATADYATADYAAAYADAATYAAATYAATATADAAARERFIVSRLIPLVVELCAMGREVPVCARTEGETLSALAGERSW